MKIIVRIANGIGNQLFSYAAAYNFAKKKICLSPLLIKNDSGYYGFSNNQDIKPDWWI